MWAVICGMADARIMECDHGWRGRLEARMEPYTSFELSDGAHSGVDVSSVAKVDIGGT